MNARNTSVRFCVETWRFLSCTGDILIFPFSSSRVYRCAPALSSLDSPDELTGTSQDKFIKREIQTLTMTADHPNVVDILGTLSTVPT